MLLVLLLSAAVCAGVPSPHDATCAHSFDDVEHWERVFDDPTRAEWQKPAEVVEALKIRPGMLVADLGAGTGYFSRHLAEAVGPTGTVYAVETEPNLVAHVRSRAEREGTPNVIPVLASADTPRLPDAGIDLVLIVDTYHHLDDRLVYLDRLARVLRPGGRVAIIEWQKRELPVGPALDHKLPRAHVVDEMRTAGYRLLAAPEMLPYQYFLIFDRGTGPSLDLRPPTLHGGAP